MNAKHELHDEDLVDLGGASVETRGQQQGLIPDNFDTRVVAGMTDE